MSCNYCGDYTQFLKDLMQGDMNEVYEPFLKRMPTRGIILNAGCGSGRDGIYFKEKGHLIVAMDTSSQTCQMAGERIGQAVLLGKFQDAHFKITFDGIWACASLVKYEVQEIKAILGHLYWYLKSEGVLYTSFCYGDSEISQNGEKYAAFSEDKAQQLFEETGYNVEKMWITQDKNSNNVNIKWLNILAGKRQ